MVRRESGDLPDRRTATQPPASSSPTRRPTWRAESPVEAASVSLDAQHDERPNRDRSRTSSSRILADGWRLDARTEAMTTNIWGPDCGRGAWADLTRAGSR